VKYIYLVFFVFSFAYSDTEFADPKPTIIEPRRIVFSIKSADDEVINHLLSSANNVLKFYGPENVNMRIVAYYHGIKMLLKKNHETAKRVDALMQIDVEFVACENTMKTKKIDKSELIEGVEIVTAGIVEMTERVQDGWINIVP
jgi:intracellular sulfur oxidation DsrE/DsrF family protein